MLHACMFTKRANTQCIQCWFIYYYNVLIKKLAVIIVTMMFITYIVHVAIWGARIMRYTVCLLWS